LYSAQSLGLRTYHPSVRFSEDVSRELVADGVTCSAVLDTEARIRVAKKVLALASPRWTDVQLKQLVLRACRNEAARRQREKKPQLVVTRKEVTWSDVGGSRNAR
jgi:hypothetical protein